MVCSQTRYPAHLRFIDNIVLTDFRISSTTLRHKKKNRYTSEPDIWKRERSSKHVRSQAAVVYNYYFRLVVVVRSRVHATRVFADYNAWFACKITYDYRNSSKSPDTFERWNFVCRRTVIVSLKIEKNRPM